jgi:hypothetical protein
MKKRSTTNHASSERGVFSQTGHHCPASGWWKPTRGEGEARFISKGELMPPLNSMQVGWTLAAETGILRQANDFGPVKVP